MPNVPYPYEVNGKLVTGNGSLIPISSLSNLSLLPSLTVPLEILHQESWWLRKMTKKFLTVSEDKWVLRTFLAKCNLRITTLSFYWTFFFFFSGENSRSTSWRASKVDSISRARRKTQGLCQVGGAIEEFCWFQF